jgi:hypothetical protein
LKAKGKYMMHTYKCGKTTFHCNGDLSGEVTILDANGSSVNIPGEDLSELVGLKMGEWVRQVLEGKSGREIMQIMVRKKKTKLR